MVIAELLHAVHHLQGHHPGDLLHQLLQLCNLTIHLLHLLILLLLRRRGKFSILFLKCRKPRLNQHRHLLGFPPRPSTVTRVTMMMIPITPRPTFLSYYRAMTVTPLAILAPPTFPHSVPHLTVSMWRRTTDRREVDCWPFLTEVEMFSLITQVTCYILLRVASATVLDTDVISALKWIVWLPPETTDTFQTTVGCTNSGHYRQASGTAQTIAEEDIVPAYSSTQCDVFICSISTSGRM